MSEHESKVEIKIGSEKNFGVVFAAVFVIVALWPLLHGNDVRWWALVVAAVFLGLAYLAPAVLTKPNRLWFRFGLLLGAIVAPIVMALVYVTTVVPTGLIFRAIGKDPLHQKPDRTAASYWIERAEAPQSMKKQF